MLTVVNKLVPRTIHHHSFLSFITPTIMMRRIVSLSSLIVFATVSNIIVSSPLVSSSSTYNAYNYDQTTPQFTPDGRLLQVEYASAAADLSPPLIVLECFSSTGNSNSNSNSKSNNNNNSQQDPCLILLTVRKRANSPQNRIVIMDDKDEQQSKKKRGGSSSSKSFPYCCVMSGILSDSLCLLQVGMKVAAEHSLRYQTSLGMVALTQALADECQSRVFGGGLRPYGSTMMLCGYDKIYNDEESTLEGDDDELLSTTSCKRNSNMNKHHRRIPLIYQTDPSGGIIQHHAAQNSDSKSDADQKKKSRRRYRNDNNNDDNNDDDDDDDTIIRSQVRCIVGGSQSLQRQLYKKIDQGMAEFEHRQQSQALSLADRIANLVEILTKEMNNDHNSNKASGVSKSRNKDDDSSSLPSLCPLEIVVISPKLGCHRLDNKQIQAIQKLINDDNKINS